MRIHNPFKHQNRSHSQKQSTALSRSLFPKNLTPDIQLGSKYASEIVKKKKKKKKAKKQQQNITCSKSNAWRKISITKDVSKILLDKHKATLVYIGTTPSMKHVLSRWGGLSNKKFQPQCVNEETSTERRS